MAPGASSLRWLGAATAALAAAWLFGVADWLWFHGLGGWLPALVPGAYWLVCLSAMAGVAFWNLFAWRRVRKGAWRPLAGYAVGSLSYLPAWQFLVFASGGDGLELHGLRAYLAQIGAGGLFILGLVWAVWLVEQASRRLAARHRRHASEHNSGCVPRRIWNPLDLRAWYYGQRSPKLRQSLATFCAYSLAFFLAMTILTQLGSCREYFYMPAGGGQQRTIAQSLQIQKVIKKKFVINPFSAIIFNPPPIDEVKLQLTEVTKHAYTVGYGAGDGAGYAGGRKGEKVRFIRLQYDGGDWNQDFGQGGDVNMLLQYAALTRQPVAERTESRTVSQLAAFPVGASPPLVYMTGQGSISLTKNEVRILREYLLTKHGMLFGDNGGSAHFHHQFFAMMHQVLPEIQPVRVPLDDPLYRVPFYIATFPYVAPHGGRDAWGWKVDGRWVVYYHPGDIGDAWSDDHAGVRREVYEACYQLGANIINYAYAQYSRWLQARQGGTKE